MKKFLLIAFATFLTIGLTAQNQQRTSEGNPNQRTQLTPEKRAERLAEQLELTAEQKTQVIEFYRLQAENREKISNENQGMNENRREKFDALRKVEDVELEKIIGKEKMEKYLKTRAERENRMREGGGNRQQNNQ